MTQEIADAWAKVLADGAPGEPGFRKMGETILADSPGTRLIHERLTDLGVGRIAHMDATGIAMQVISITSPGVQVFAPDLAALTELRDSGGLRRLADKDIRAAITDWERSLAEVSRKYGDGLRERDTVLIPYMMQNIAYGPLLEKSSLVADTVGVSKFRNDFAALADSREFDNQIAYRYGNCGSTIHSLDKLDVETAQLVEALRAREATQ